MAMKPLLDPDDPFFRKPLVRWLTVLLPAAWAGFEFWNGSPGWALAFAAAAGYAGWMLFVKRKPDGATPPLADQDHPEA